TITISNSGTGAATGVLFNDVPDATTSLVVGSVTTTAGTVTHANSAGNTSVSVNVGTIAPAATVTITFRVTINSPLPAGVQQVANSGSVSGTNFSSVATDDPAFPGPSDPTVTPVTAMPIVSATKTAAISSDANG